MIALYLDNRFFERNKFVIQMAHISFVGLVWERSQNSLVNPMVWSMQLFLKQNIEFNPLPDDKILDSSKLKQTAYDI